MGRKIRRVPPHWEHPRKNCEHSPWNGGCGSAKANAGTCYQPLYDQDFDSAMQEWLDGFSKWKESEFATILVEHPDEGYNADEPFRAYCDWSGTPPDLDYYRPKWKDGEASWYQLYETVSEGTPVSPPFAEKEDLAQWLSEHGDYWYQQDMANPSQFGTFRTKPTIEQARSLIDTGWAMSMMAIIPETGGGQLFDPYQQQDLKPA